MGDPVVAVAAALYEAWRRALNAEWLEVPAEVRAPGPPCPADFHELTPLDHRCWIAVAREALEVAPALAAIAKVVQR